MRNQVLEVLLRFAFHYENVLHCLLVQLEIQYYLLNFGLI